MWSAGHQQDRSTINYEVPGDMDTRVFGVFLALGAIAFAFGDTVLPEIQVISILLTMCAAECKICPSFAAACTWQH